MVSLQLFFFLALISIGYSQCTPSLQLLNPRTGASLQTFNGPTTVRIKSLTRSFDVLAEFCSDGIRSVVFTISGDTTRRIDNNAPYKSGVVGRGLISRIRQRAIDSGGPQFINAMAFDGFKGTGTMVESFQLTLDVKRSAVVSSSPTPSPISIPSPSPSPFAPASVFLQSPNPSTFNAAGPLVFGIIGGTFDQAAGNVILSVNDVLVPIEDIILTPTLLTANSDLEIGLNNVTLSISSLESEVVLTLSTSFWIGTQELTVNLVDFGGDPFLTPSQVTATLADNLTVQSITSTSTGTVTFENLPPRTIIIDVLSEDNDVGAGATLSSDGPIFITIAGFDEPSTVDNNDFSFGLDGLESSSPSTTVIVEHTEEVGPMAGSPEPEDSSIIDNDLELTTDGEGSQQVVRTFMALPGTTGVRVRFRFITSEIPGGFFGSMFNDFFSVSIRSQIAGDSIVESASMNGLGFDAFDPITGSTDWRETVLQLNAESDVIEVRVTVANVGDGLFDSSVIVDFIEELS